MRIKPFLLLPLAAAIAFLASPSAAHSVTRGPLLHMPKPTFSQFAKKPSGDLDHAIDPSETSDESSGLEKGSNDGSRAPRGMDRQPPASSLSAVKPAHDLTPWGMFLAADIVVKSVMVSLVIASLLSWAVWIAKSIDIALTRRELRKARLALTKVNSLSEAVREIAPRMRRASKPVAIAYSELQSAPQQSSATSIKERVALRLNDLIAGSTSELRRGTGLLATVGSMAPFVGLFGTVWGIMNSFIGISESQTTNLAIVAPGIAEALLATATGLFAAIPAVIFYNRLTRSIAACRSALSTLAVETQLLLSRDLDQADVGVALSLERVA